MTRLRIIDFSSQADEKLLEVREVPGGRGGFSSWEVREGQRSERRIGSVERLERIIFK
ncbi:hypothetical protein [Methanocella sp. MCL-LM]|uniref:hypothetical protein n=1 Tax=Methanocella sp. MCL-LM TaxID=3412035 RepID=UPI003C745856